MKFKIGDIVLMDFSTKDFTCNKYGMIIDISKYPKWSKKLLSDYYYKIKWLEDTLILQISIELERFLEKVG